MQEVTKMKKLDQIYEGKAKKVFKRGTTAAGLRAMEPSLMLAVEGGVDAALVKTVELGQAKRE